MDQSQSQSQNQRYDADLPREPVRGDDTVVGNRVESGRYDLAGAPEGLGTLISGIVKDVQDMVRGEIQLAKTELQEDVTTIGRSVGMIAAGAFFGLVAFIFLMLAVTYLLDIWMRQWIAAGIVGVSLAVIAGILAMVGKNRLSAANLKPEQTIETLKEDKEWASQQINSVKR